MKTDLGEKEEQAANTRNGQMALPCPYYQDSAVTIYQGDCLPILHALGAVDIVITDPPYSEHVHANGMRGARDGKGDIRGESKHFGFESISDELMRSLAYWLNIACKRWALVFSDIETAPDWRDAVCGAGLEYIRTGAWVKIAPTPQFTGDRPAAGFETVSIFHPKGKKKWNGGGKAAVWRHCAHGGERDIRLHPAQKPIDLLYELVFLFSDVGETIFDPFMGSGTTLRAAKDLGRRAIGIEIEERYCEIAAKRMEQEILDFGASAICPVQVEEQEAPLLNII